MGSQRVGHSWATFTFYNCPLLLEPPSQSPSQVITECWGGLPVLYTSFLLFFSVPKLCLVLCDPLNWSTPGFPVHHHLPELAQTHVHWVSDAIQPSHHVAPFSSCPQSFPASGSFPMSRVFASGGQNIEALVSASSFKWIFRADFL